MRQISRRKKKLYPQKFCRTGAPKVTKAAYSCIIFRQRNNDLWRFNKEAWAWMVDEWRGNKVCLSSFLSLEFPNLGDKNDFYPGIERITSHRDLVPAFRGKGVGVMVVRVFVNIFPHFFQVFLNNLPSNWVHVCDPILDSSKWVNVLCRIPSSGPDWDWRVLWLQWIVFPQPTSWKADRMPGARTDVPENETEVMCWEQKGNKKGA